MDDVVEFARRTVAQAGPLSGHSPADLTFLRSVSAVTGTWAAPLAGVYESWLRKDPETTAVLDAVEASGHQDAFEQWFGTIVTGAVDSAFWERTCLIGMLHAGAGVRAGQVVCMGRLVEEHLLAQCVRAFPADLALRVFAAAKRVFAVALTLILETSHDVLMTGIKDTGVNEKTAERIRARASTKMLAEAREVLGAG